jgi:hypothetical protein
MKLYFTAKQKNIKTVNGVTSSEYDLLVGDVNVGLGILQSNVEYSQGSLGGISVINNQWILNLNYAESNLNMGYYYENISQSTTPSKDPIVSKVMVTYITGRDAVDISMDNLGGSIKTIDNINYDINIFSM